MTKNSDGNAGRELEPKHILAIGAGLLVLTITIYAGLKKADAEHAALYADNSTQSLSESSGGIDQKGQGQNVAASLIDSNEIYGVTNNILIGCRTTDVARLAVQRFLAEPNATIDFFEAQWAKDNETGRKHLCWAMPPATKVIIRFKQSDDFECVSEVRKDTGKADADCYYGLSSLIDEGAD